MTEEVTYTVKYPPRSVVYDIDKAKKGVLEKVCIKSFKVNVNKSTANQPVILYKDTYNWLWMENMLCPEAAAVEYAIAYWTRVLAQIEEAEDD